MVSASPTSRRGLTRARPAVGRGLAPAPHPPRLCLCRGTALVIIVLASVIGFASTRPRSPVPGLAAVVTDSGGVAVPLPRRSPLTNGVTSPVEPPVGPRWSSRRPAGVDPVAEAVDPLTVGVGQDNGGGHANGQGQDNGIGQGNGNGKGAGD